MKNLTWRQKKVGLILTTAFNDLKALESQAPNSLDERSLQKHSIAIRRLLRSLGVDPIKGDWFSDVATVQKTDEGTGEEKVLVEGDELTTEEKYNGRLSKEHTAAIIDAYREGLTVEQISDKLHIESAKIEGYVSKQSKAKMLGDD